MTSSKDGGNRQLPDSMERSLRSLRQSTRVAVATALLEDGDAAAALSISEIMVQEEPESESGHEIAIRVHVRRGDRAAALAQWDRYRSIVRHDFEVEPSAELRRLIH
jgi:DNA-binding SARP family transcriptional activator